MKALLINGSPRTNGCTFTVLTELKNTLEKEGIDAEIIHVGHKDIHGCTAYRKCAQTGKCVFDDIVNEVAPKFAEADAFVIGAPVYTLPRRAAQFAVNVWGISSEGKTDEELAKAGVEALADFIKEIGMPTTLRELGIEENINLKEIADSCGIVGGSYKKMTHEEIFEIFKEVM